MTTIVPNRTENTFESFLENYFNNIITPPQQEDYIDLDNVMNRFDIEEVITTYDSLTQFQRSIVEYLSGDIISSGPQTPHPLSQKENCNQQGLSYNEHKDNCCGPNQEYNPSSKRCKNKLRGKKKKVTISETVTIMEQCEQQGLAYNEHTDKCCKEGQIYKSGNKRCTNPPKKNSKSPKKKSKTPKRKRRQSTDEAGPSKTQREICEDKGLAYNEHTDKCCSNKNMEYKIGNKRCNKKK